MTSHSEKVAADLSNPRAPSFVLILEFSQMLGERLTGDFLNDGKRDGEPASFENLFDG